MTTTPVAAPPAAAHVVDRLVAEQLVHPAQRDRAVGVVASALRPDVPMPDGSSLPRRGGTTAVVEVVAYLGAALVLAAGGLFGSVYWDDLELGAQVGLLGVMALVLGCAGVATTVGHLAAVRAQRVASDPRRRLASTLLVGAALSATGLAGLLADRGGLPTGYDPGSDALGTDWVSVVVASTGLVVLLLGRRLADSALATLGLFSTSTWLVSTLVGPEPGPAGLVAAGALGLLALTWLGLVETRRLAVGHADLARVLGSGLALWAAQTPVTESWSGHDHAWVGYALTVLLVVAATAAYLRRGAWPYLAVAVVGVTVVVPEGVYDWTDGGLGAIGAVLVTGVSLLVAAGLGALVRSRRATA